jgi:dipeptidase
MLMPTGSRVLSPLFPSIFVVCATVTEDRGSTWTSANVDANLKQRDTWLDPKWGDAMVIGHIPQVPHTFASLEGLYGIINEKQVAIGESTCGSRFFAGPNGDSCTMCTSLLDVSELSRLAMERASTAREAIQIMGDLAVQYGFYGSEWDPSDDTTYLEAAEALTVTDPHEAWIFHVSSDDTATSAVWAAQRVPDGHVSVVANQFTIRTIDPAASADDMMFSSNLWTVAERAGLWSPDQGTLLDFAGAFSVRPGDTPHYAYSTRRVWRVLDLAAPSLKLSPYTNRYTVV